jgi:hypothetical protein
MLFSKKQNISLFGFEESMYKSDCKTQDIQRTVYLSCSSFAAAAAAASSGVCSTTSVAFNVSTVKANHPSLLNADDT